MKWWSQSFVVGTSQIVCGFRDDWGMVHKLENFEVLKIPRMAGVSTVFVIVYYIWNQILNRKELIHHLYWNVRGHIPECTFTSSRTFIVAEDSNERFYVLW